MNEDNNSIIPVSQAISLFEKQFAIGEKLLSNLVIGEYVLILLEKNRIQILDKDKFNFSVLEHETLSICRVKENQLLYLFSQTGYSYSIRFYELLQNNTTHLEAVFENVLDEIFSIVPIPDTVNLESTFLFFTTRRGIIKKILIQELPFKSIRKIQVINLKAQDVLTSVKVLTNQKQILISSKNHKSIRFESVKIPSLSRFAGGKRGISLQDEDDEVVGVSTISSFNSVITFSEKGFVKKSNLDDFRITNLGGKGVMNNHKLVGSSISVFHTTDDDEFIIFSTIEIKKLKSRDVLIEGRGSKGIKIVEGSIYKVIKIRSCELN